MRRLTLPSQAGGQRNIHSLKDRASARSPVRYSPVKPLWITTHSSQTPRWCPIGSGRLMSLSSSREWGVDFDLSGKPGIHKRLSQPRVMAWAKPPLEPIPPIPPPGLAIAAATEESHHEMPLCGVCRSPSCSQLLTHLAVHDGFLGANSAASVWHSLNATTHIIHGDGLGLGHGRHRFSHSRSVSIPMCIQQQCPCAGVPPLQKSAQARVLVNAQRDLRHNK